MQTNTIPTYQLETVNHAIPNDIVATSIPINSTFPMSVPKSLVENLERVLSQRHVPALFEPIRLLGERVQPVYEAMGSIYIHPLDELVQVLNNWENVGQFSALSQSERTASIARVVTKELSLCTYASIVRETSERWMMHDETYGSFKARNAHLTVVVFTSDPNPLGNLLLDWLLMCATPKH
jgi:hypothetical protein